MPLMVMVGLVVKYQRFIHRKPGDVKKNMEKCKSFVQALPWFSFVKLGIVIFGVFKIGVIVLVSFIVVHAILRFEAKKSFFFYRCNNRGVTGWEYVVAEKEIVKKKIGYYKKRIQGKVMKQIYFVKNQKTRIEEDMASCLDVVRRIKYAIFYFIVSKNLEVFLIYNGGRVLLEVWLQRYGMHGVMMMGGNGMFLITEGKETPVQIVEIAGEDFSKHFNQRDFPKIENSVEYAPLTEQPPEKVNEFIAVSANNAIELRSYPTERSYKDKYIKILEDNRDLRAFLPDTWHEFQSCGRFGIVNTVKNGSKVEDFPVYLPAIPNGADLMTVEGKLLQLKTLEKLHSNDFYKFLKYRTIITNNGMEIVVITRHAQIDVNYVYEYQKQNPSIWKSLFVQDERRMPRVQPEHVDQMREGYANTICRKNYDEKIKMLKSNNWIPSAVYFSKKALFRR